MATCWIMEAKMVSKVQSIIYTNPHYSVTNTYINCLIWTPSFQWPRYSSSFHQAVYAYQVPWIVGKIIMT